MTKLTVVFNEFLNSKLHQRAVLEKRTKVSIIRRALALYFFVTEEITSHPKRKFVVMEGDKVVKEIVLI